MNKKPPADLGKAGRALWRDVTSQWTLRPDELRVLAEAARELDLAERLRDELKTAPTTVRGSQGQQVINPIISELRQHRATFTSMMRFLALPDTDEKEEEKPGIGHFRCGNSRLRGGNVARRKNTGRSGLVPRDLPNHLRNPQVAQNPESDRASRQYQAFQSFKVYARELSGWLNSQDHAKHLDINEVMEALGTTLDDFYAVAIELRPEARASDRGQQA